MPSKPAARTCLDAETSVHTSYSISCPRQPLHRESECFTEKSLSPSGYPLSGLPQGLPGRAGSRKRSAQNPSLPCSSRSSITLIAAGSIVTLIQEAREACLTLFYAHPEMERTRGKPQSFLNLAPQDLTFFGAKMGMLLERGISDEKSKLPRQETVLRSQIPT